MTERERAGKAVESARRHVAMFRDLEALERGRLEAGGPYPVDEAESRRQMGYYAVRVKDSEAMLKAANDEMAALDRKPLA